MSKQSKSYDAKEMFLRGILAFGRAMGLMKNPYSDGYSQVHRTKDEDRKRRKSHAKFKAQRIARREQRA